VNAAVVSTLGKRVTAREALWRGERSR